MRITHALLALAVVAQQALAQSPVEGTEAGIVIEVYQPGYVLGESVLRAARVVVSG